MWALIAVLAGSATLVACGDDGARMLPDAPPSGSDGAVDAPVDVPAGGSVTVTVWNQGVRDPDAVVLFQTANGTISSRVAVDANGVATGEVPTGGMVTAVQDGELTTIVQVAGGDSISVGGEVAPMSGSSTVTVPAAPGGTTNHVVVSPCGAGSNASTTITLQLYTTCPQPAPVIAIANAGNTNHAYLVDTAATIVASGTTALTGTWVTPPSFAWSVTNLPAMVTNVSASVGSRVGTTSLFTPATTLPAPSAGATSATRPAPPALGTGTLLRYFLSDTLATQMVSRAIASTSATAPTSDTLDATNLLPWIQSIQESFSGVVWTQSSGDPYDGAIVTVEFQYKTATFVTWKVVAPATARQVTLPTLPPDLNTMFSQTDSVAASVTLYDSDAFDYAAMRAKGGTDDFARDRGLPAVYALRTSSR